MAMISSWSERMISHTGTEIRTPTGGSSEEFCAMSESLTQQRRVIEEGLRIVKICYKGRIAYILTKYLFDGTL